MRQVAMAIGIAAALLLGGCQDEDPQHQVFDQLLASDMGLGIHLGDSQTTVNELLGTAYTTRELPGDIMEHYYFSTEKTTIDSETPQLMLTYQADRLIRIYNRYYPADAEMPYPPHFAEFLPGMKLGNRKSDVVSPLGPPTNETMGTEWRLTAEDGRILVIRAGFTEMPSTSLETADQRCSMLYLALTEPVGMSEGEVEEKKVDWRDLGKDEDS